ncbi:MAG TPA: MFS transporter [Methanomassiliicoccales archaeon]|nr:MFS transporter [Methanomassiliicoccales archaeon]
MVSSGWSRSQRFMIISISLATFMSSLDASIVSIAIPTIAEEFRTTTTMVSWIIIIYGLMLSSLLLSFGKLADITGFKRWFMIGLVIFTAGSALSGLAPSIELLIAFRALQGVGGSILAALTLAMVSRYLPQESKGKGLGIVSTFLALGVALGPVIGGVLTEYLSWRWIFFVNVPFCAIAIVMGLRYVPADAAGRNDLSGFDVRGAVLFFASISAFLLALNLSNQWGWASPSIIGLIMLAAVLLFLFLWNERKAISPMLARSIVSNRNILMENFAGLSIMGATGGAILLMPFYFELVRGQSTSDTGFLLLSSSVAIMIFGFLAGKLSDRSGSRMLCVAGCLVAAGSFAMLATIGTATSMIFVLFSLFLLGAGFGTYLSPAGNLILRQTRKEDEGVSTGLINTTRNLGYIIGLTIMESVFAMAVVKNLGATPAELVQGFHAAFWVGMAICLVAALFAFMAKDAPSSG